MMIGLDTNVLLRYFVKDDPIQWERATHFVSTRCTEENPGFIDRVALCEMLWVLSRGYRYRRDAIAGVVEQLLAARELLLEDEDIVRSALRGYRQSNVELTDILMSHINRARGCDATATFDREAAKIDGFVRVG